MSQDPVRFDRAGEGDFHFLVESIERYNAYDGKTSPLDAPGSFAIQKLRSAIELQVETDNTEALALYEKRGFARHTRYVMSKRLRT